MFTPKIKMKLFRNYGFTKEAFNDEDWEIRLAAYKSLGFTKKNP